MRMRFAAGCASSVGGEGERVDAAMERDDEKERGKQRARQDQSERMHGPESRQQPQLLHGESKSDGRERDARGSGERF